MKFKYIGFVIGFLLAVLAVLANERTFSAFLLGTGLSGYGAWLGEKLDAYFDT